MQNEPTLENKNGRALENQDDACVEGKTRLKLLLHLRGEGMGHESRACTHQRAFCPQFLFKLATYIAFVSLTAAWTMGTEGSGSVYPIGAETVMPGMTPAAGQTVFAEFNTTYQANSFLDAQGHSAVPGFKVAAYAFAPKITHNWGAHLLGGTLVSWVAFPCAYEWLRTPSGKYSAAGISNPVLGIADIAYDRGNWHWWYGLDAEVPAPVFHKDGPINIGQHNFATAPSGAFTYLPDHGRTEISSRLQYIVNDTDTATHYHSGNEFLWEYVAMQNVTKKLGIGVNGYLYKQTTDDRLLGVIYAGGNRGRDLAVGPEVRYQLGPTVLIAKYIRDSLVQNRPCGNAFWIEIALPLSRPHANLQAKQ